MELNKIYQGNCLDVIKTFPNECIDCVITSPPYWQLRDYGWDGQWGLEPTYKMYLENLWSLMDEIKRVLKSTGTAWVNLGDTYGSTKTGNIDNKHKGNVGCNIDKIDGIQKCLMLIPHRFAIGCIDRGWIVRNDIVWAKRNAMPESVIDRFSKKHEYFFLMTKSTKYYFDLDSIRDKVKEESIERYNYDYSGNKGNVDRNKIGYTEGNKSHLISKKNQYSILDKEYRNQIVEVRDLPDHNILREYLSKARKSGNITIQEIEDIFGTQAPHHWFEKNGSYPSKEDWIKLKEILNFDDTYDNQLTNITLKSGLKQNNPNGKNPGSVSDFWDILTKPSSKKHYAIYNDKLIEKPIMAGCPKDGIILDPFCGTATTGVRALQLDRNFIGIEGSEKYVRIGERELHKEKSQTTLNF